VGQKEKWGRIALSASDRESTRPPLSCHWRSSHIWLHDTLMSDQSPSLAPTNSGELRAKASGSYVQLRSIYFGADALRPGRLVPGRITVLIDRDPEFSVEGQLDHRGLLSGMARLYSTLGLQDGDEVVAALPSAGIGVSTLVVVGTTPSRGPYLAGVPVQNPLHATSDLASALVFERRALRHIHIEPFRPESLNHWEPETETDVYMAFGVLAEFTDFRYCCGASIELLRRLGADYSAQTKPDAILIDRRSDQYLMAEWKMRSADYRLNHKPEDVDVLVCWTDEEQDRSILPSVVLPLREIARKAAEVALQR